MLLERCGPCVPEKAGTAEGERVTAMLRQEAPGLSEALPQAQLKSPDLDTLDD